MENDFGKRLKEARLNKKYTQQKLCDILNNNYLSGSNNTLTRNAITMYETGARKPNYDILVALSHALNVDVNYLIGSSNKKHSHIVNHAYKTLEASIQNLLEQDNEELNSLIFTLLTNINDTVKIKETSTNALVELNNLIYEYNKKRIAK